MPSDSADSLRLSFLTPIGYQTSSCGYCKNPASSEKRPSSRASYYASAKKLTPEDYQVLVDRGWRRSGTLIYKPDNRLSCCPQYTVRIPVAEFRCRKDQRSALHAWNRHVLGDHYIKEAARLYPKSKQDKRQSRNSFDLTTAVHAAEYANVKTPPEPSHRFEVTLEADTFTDEKFELFRHYQEHVHHEPASKTRPAGFSRFLCQSPVVRESQYDLSTRKVKRLGSYHQMYRLDGRLIAIGVLDLLPNCVSGVYFVYHADFEKFSLGKLSALREASLALEDGYGHYYMGYYIHACPKMRYKGDYQPQYFLDLDDFSWAPLDEQATGLMEKQKYVSMSRERRNREAPGDDEAEAPPYGNVQLAEESGESALRLGLPGVMAAAQVEKQIDLDDINVQVGREVVTKTRNLVAWDKGSIEDSTSLKGIVAELAGCVGPEVIRPERSVVRFIRD